MPVKLHDASAYMTLLNNCDLIERPPTPEQPLTRKEQRERDILASKQAHIRAREQEYARQLQSSKVRSQRKLEAANAQKAQELEHQYTALLDARKEGGWYLSSAPGLVIKWGMGKRRGSAPPFGPTPPSLKRA